MNNNEFSTAQLPLDIRAKLAEIELELSEGDITKKGYQKKRNKLLAPYVGKRQLRAGSQSSEDSPRIRRHRTSNRRDDIRYQSEIRTEAVHAALARHRHEQENAMMPLPSTRRTPNAHSPQPVAAENFDSDDADEDNSIDDIEENSTLEGSLPSQGRQGKSQSSSSKSLSQRSRHSDDIVSPSTHAPPVIPQQQQPQQQQPPPQPVIQPSPPRPSQSMSGTDTYVIKGNTYVGMPSNQSRSGQSHSESLDNPRSSSQQPDITLSVNTLRRADLVAAGKNQRQTQAEAAAGDQDGRAAHSKTSAKIQQLVQTLARPKRRPLPEMYVEESEEFVCPPDPNAPRPQGEPSIPAVGEAFTVPPGLPVTLEEALVRHASDGNAKLSAISMLEVSGKCVSVLNFNKLSSRVRKLAFNLLNKLGHRGEQSLKPGDRVGLVFPNTEPANFVVAFAACQMAGLVPVAVDVPPFNVAQSGFLLCSLEVRVLLTSETCHRALPRINNALEPVSLPGWPASVYWAMTTSGLSSPPRDWQPPALRSGSLDPNALAYVEAATGRDGSVRGVCITRSAVIAHCHSVAAACGYVSGETVVCLLDPKREVGLWHAVLVGLLCGMHVIYVPYSVMKTDPASWLRVVSKYRASVALTRSRDLYWALLSQNNHKDLNLSSLRCLLVADGSNPWSLTSCDSFLNVFQTLGLRPESICPCAFSSETMTISLRRPWGHNGSLPGSTGRGVLSMLGLSHSVVRVDSENSYTSLTLQDCGLVMPGASVAVVKLAPGVPTLCKQDEVGEICVCARYTGTKYWGLPGLSNHTFKCQPLLASGDPVSERDQYVRTGLIGFLGPPASGGLVFICGSLDGLMIVSHRRHNADDLIATVLAVEPLKFVFRGRIAVFSQEILRDERIIIVAEQRPDASEEQCFQWMSHVLQAVDSIHQVGIYCIALVPANKLPRSPLGGINVHETRRCFLAGMLHPANILMCPHSTVTNLPTPREPIGEGQNRAGPMSIMLGSLVQGARLAEAQGRSLPIDEGFMTLSEALMNRCRDPEHRLFTCFNSKLQEVSYLTSMALHKRAERISSLLRSRAHSGAIVALMFPPGVELIAAVFGCFYAGCIPLPVRPPLPQNLASTLPTCKLIVENGQAVILLTTSSIIKLLKSKEALAQGCSWPPLLDLDDSAKKRSFSQPNTDAQHAKNGPSDLAYLDFAVSTTGLLAGIRVSHLSATAICRAVKLQCELYPTREVALCLDPYSGLAFALWCLVGVFSGHHSLLLPPAELEANPSAFLQMLSQRQVRDAFCSYGVIELFAKELGKQVDFLKLKPPVNLSCLRSLVVVAEERPRIKLVTSFSKLFAPIGLKASAVSTSFGCRVCPGICLQGASSPETTTLYVDARALRNDRVTLVERGSPNSLMLHESGKLLYGVKVAIANPETRSQCADSHLGEIWVNSPHCADGYFSVLGGDAGDHFEAHLTSGDTQTTYSRTGYLGFVRRTELTGSDGERHDALFLIGALDEAILLRGMRYHPYDIEMTVVRCHSKICECAVFTWRSLLVVVAELEGREQDALDLVPPITSSILQEHYLIAGVVVICDPGTVPLNSRGEKQRMHLRDGFLDDKLDPIYVAYNL